MGKNKTINYELGVRITISCRMNFDDSPLDAHPCQFQVGSYYDTKDMVTCTAAFIYDLKRQRSLQHFLTIEDLPEQFHTVVIPSGNYSACGFQVRLQRKQMQYVIQVYLPSCMFVIVSWVSFMVKPEVVPGRMAMLVTLFLVLINIFNSVREQAPISSRLNAVDLYLVVCIFFVFTFFHLSNKSLPWDYNFRFVIEEISNINDKAQSMVISMYFAVSWEEPRMVINESAVEWRDARTGPTDEVNESPETLRYIWYPELEIYGLETFGRQSVLKEITAT